MTRSNLKRALPFVAAIVASAAAANAYNNYMSLNSRSEIRKFLKENGMTEYGGVNVDNANDIELYGILSSLFSKTTDTGILHKIRNYQKARDYENAFPNLFLQSQMRNFGRKRNSKKRSKRNSKKRGSIRDYSKLLKQAELQAAYYRKRYNSPEGSVMGGVGLLTTAENWERKVEKYKLKIAQKKDK